MSGAIIRVKKASGEFFVGAKRPFNDERLSWEARGLMGYLLTKPDDWECRNSDLINKGPAGRDKIKGMLAELKRYKYMRRFREAGEGGRFVWTTEIYEIPELNPDYDSTIDGFTVDGSAVDGSAVDGKAVHILSNNGLSNKSTNNKERDRARGFSEADKKRLNDLADEVADLCSIVLDRATEPTREALREFVVRIDGEGKTVADVKRFREDYWYVWAKTPPRIRQLPEEWDRYFSDESSGSGNSSSAPKLTEEQLKRLEELESD